MTQEQQSSVSETAPHALAAEQATGVPAELILAQWALESGWGEHQPGKNCFGIKYCGAYGSQLLDTSEWFTDSELEHFLARENGRSAILVQPVRRNLAGRKLYACRDVFAAFGSLEDCFGFHAGMLTRGVYKPAFSQYQRDHNLQTLVFGIAQHYSTSDPAEYAEKILQIAKSAPVVDALRSGRASFVVGTLDSE